MIKKIYQKCLSRLPFISNNTNYSVEIDESGWNDQYNRGRWSYLGQLSELAHYSVIVGYCQHFALHGKILDVGCGEAVLQQRLAILPYGHYTGIDISSVAIENAQQYRNNRTEFHAVDAMSFQPDERYNIIIFNESLYCFNDCIKILQYYQNLLTDDGIFIISMHVQELSLKHWKRIEEYHDVIDSVRITNQENTSWICKAIQRKRND